VTAQIARSHAVAHGPGAPRALTGHPTAAHESPTPGRDHAGSGAIGTKPPAHTPPLRTRGHSHPPSPVQPYAGSAPPYAPQDPVCRNKRPLRGKGVKGAVGGGPGRGVSGRGTLAQASGRGPPATGVVDEPGVNRAQFTHVERDGCSRPRQGRTASGACGPCWNSGSTWAARSCPVAASARAAALRRWNSTAWRWNVTQSFVRASTAALSCVSGCEGQDCHIRLISTHPRDLVGW
jgi:hypothetical protein